MRLHLFALLFALPLSSSLLAQKAKSPSAAASPPGTGHITGTVFCSDTHRPARGAMVMLTAIPADQPSATSQADATQVSHTGLDGTYRFDHVPAGNFTVFAFFAGYATAFTPEDIDAMMSHAGGARQDFLRHNGVVSLAQGGTGTFDVTINRGASISGHVMYSDGSPAAQVTLDLQDTHADPKATSEDVQAGALFGRMFAHQNLSTDDQGSFRIAGLDPGSYRVAAMESPVSSDTREEAMFSVLGLVDKTRALHIYAGNTTHQADAKTFDLRAGDEQTGVDITIPLDAFQHVSGTVTAMDGRFLNMGDLTLTDAADPKTSFTAKLTVDGTFSFPNVPSATYQLAITNAHIGKTPAPDPHNPYLSRYMPLQPTNNFADDSITLIVKNTEVTDARLTLKEVPMPPVDKSKPADNED